MNTWTPPQVVFLRIRNNYFLTPIEFKVFAIFTFAATLCYFFERTLLPQSIREQIIPITGWSPFHDYPMLFLFIMMSLGINSRPLLINKWQFIPIALLAVSIYHGYVGMTMWHGVEHSNPYLRISEWRPLYAIILPSLWILILLSPRVAKFYTALADGYPARN